MPDKKVADLHVHTYLSDGTFSPREVLECAKACGLDAIAISDHDTVDAIDECIALSAEFGIEVIPAVELGSHKDKSEIHILGYFIDRHAGWFKEELDDIRSARMKRAEKMLDKLKENGVDLDMKDLMALAGPGSVGRLHIAQLMFDKGYINSIGDAFYKYIGNSDSCYVRYTKLEPKDAIRMILKAGGIPVLAHPHTMGHDEYISGFVDEGLRGIEVYHSDNPGGANRRYTDIAEKYSLLMTGGSDCHGMGKGRILMGKVKIPYSLVEKLKEAKGI